MTRDLDASVELKGSISHADEHALRQDGISFAMDSGLTDPDTLVTFEVAAVLSDPLAKHEPDGLSDGDAIKIRQETTSRWTQNPTQYMVIVLCSMCAAIQGMDESVINGAQLQYKIQFGINDNEWLNGIVTAAPYLSCAVLGCWLTIPLNNTLGRRGVIFVGAILSLVACIWQAITNDWWHMMIARFALGLAIGPMSATVPMYAAETSPASIRGALTMQWQMWTAFGIALGLAVDLAFFQIQDRNGIVGLAWRLQMGSPAVLAAIVAIGIFFAPESPRWLMQKGKHADAYHAMCRLRRSNVQAARDVYKACREMQAEATQQQGNWLSKIKDMVYIPRYRHAMFASLTVMFMQQFCGINVMAYYSSSIFVNSGFNQFNAIAASLGFGVVNFVFAIPALFTIDRLGRRRLLLVTFPAMAFFLVWVASGFYIPAELMDGRLRLGIIASGIYLFAAVYSVGAGPVPFTYSAEAYPLRVRTYGMSLATAVTWLFNAVLGITFPALQSHATPSGTFFYYAAWNVIGACATFFFVRETKMLTLEELDDVFSASVMPFVRERFAALPRDFPATLRELVVLGGDMIVGLFKAPGVICRLFWRLSKRALCKPRTKLQPERMSREWTASSADKEGNAVLEVAPTRSTVLTDDADVEVAKVETTAASVPGPGKSG